MACAGVAASRGRCALPQDLNKTHSPRQTAQPARRVARSGTEWRAAEAPRGQRPHNQSAHPTRPGPAPCGEATAHRRPSAGTTPNSVKDDYPPLLSVLGAPGQRRAEVVARHGQGCVSRPTGLRGLRCAEAPIGLERPISPVQGTRPVVLLLQPKAARQCTAHTLLRQVKTTFLKLSHLFSGFERWASVHTFRPMKPGVRHVDAVV